MSAPLFRLGQIVATPGALDASRIPVTNRRFNKNDLLGTFQAASPARGTIK